MVAKYIVYADPAHSWIRVPMKEVVELKLADQISECSYISYDKQWAFLEEDQDMSLFVKTTGLDLQDTELVTTVTSNSESFVRSYPRFKIQTPPPAERPAFTPVPKPEPKKRGRPKKEETVPVTKAPPIALPSNETPVRRQYKDIKKQFPDAIVFFRLGDFYETFDADAELVAKELDIVLSSRSVGKDQRVPMAGVPYHVAEDYIKRLIAKGHHVAVVEQVGNELIDGLMPREVARVIKPEAVAVEETAAIAEETPVVVEEMEPVVVEAPVVVSTSTINEIFMPKKGKLKNLPPAPKITTLAELRAWRDQQRRAMI